MAVSRDQAAPHGVLGHPVDFSWVTRLRIRPSERVLIAQRDSIERLWIGRPVSQQALLPTPIAQNTDALLESPNPKSYFPLARSTTERVRMPEQQDVGRRLDQRRFRGISQARDSRISPPLVHQKNRRLLP